MRWIRKKGWISTQSRSWHPSSERMDFFKTLLLLSPKCLSLYCPSKTDGNMIALGGCDCMEYNVKLDVQFIGIAVASLHNLATIMLFQWPPFPDRRGWLE